MTEAHPSSKPARVTVIIPTFNREVFVLKAVRSVLKQTFKEYELVVVDDGSTDGTGPALQPYANQIRYVYQNNAGASAARNRGVSLATGEWIAFLDSDDEWAEEYLSKQMEAAGENGELCMQIMDCRYADGDGEHKSYFENNGVVEKFNGANCLQLQRPFEFLVRNQPWQLGSVIIRRDAIRKAGMFDESFGITEDLDLMARVALQGPVRLLKDKLTTAYRRSETTEHLCRIIKTDPVRARRSDDRLYQKLDSLPALSRNDRRAVKWARSANQRAIGNLLFAEGKIQDARKAYWMALKIDPSIRSIGKYLISRLATSPSRTRPNSIDLKPAQGE